MVPVSWAGFARGADLTASAMAARFLAAGCCVRGLSVALSLGSGVLYASACLLVPYMPLGWSSTAVAQIARCRFETSATAQTAVARTPPRRQDMAPKKKAKTAAPPLACFAGAKITVIGANPFQRKLWEAKIGAGAAFLKLSLIHI